MSVSAAIHSGKRPGSPSTHGITFAFWVGVHFPQEGVATSGCAVVAEAEPGPQPHQAGKEYKDP